MSRASAAAQESETPGWSETSDSNATKVSLGPPAQVSNGPMVEKSLMSRQLSGSVRTSASPPLKERSSTNATAFFTLSWSAMV
jgi:hypothetical protein